MFVRKETICRTVKSSSPVNAELAQRNDWTLVLLGRGTRRFCYLNVIGSVELWTAKKEHIMYIQ